MNGVDGNRFAEKRADFVMEQGYNTLTFSRFTILVSAYVGTFSLRNVEGSISAEAQGLDLTDESVTLGVKIFEFGCERGKFGEVFLEFFKV